LKLQQWAWTNCRLQKQRQILPQRQCVNTLILQS
jgi:hypothetical protein